MYKLHTVCRACGYGKDPNPSGIKALPNNQKLIPVLDLGLQPLANDFHRMDEPRSGFIPLKVLFCPQCSLAQLSVVVDPMEMYRHYSYVTSTSKTMLEHFGIIADDLKSFKGGKLGKVLEIGSNDGALLDFLSDQSEVVTGVDPADNLAEIANDKGIKTYNAVWNSLIAKQITFSGQYDTIIARHVFAHVDDWHEFIRALDVAGNENVLVYIEVPYAGDLLKMKAFDTIYHEHLSYVTYKSIEWLLDQSPFYLYRVEHYSIHGGAIGLILKKKGKDFKAGNYTMKESITADDWVNLETQCGTMISELTHEVNRIRAAGKTVCGFGASAKSTVWISACRFMREHLSFICDCTPQKQLKFSPQTDIPIVDEGALLRELPDYAIIFSWNFADEIISKNKLYLEKGGKFIIPLPELKVVEHYIRRNE